MTATGGFMILAIGLNLFGLTKIRVANLDSGYSRCWGYRVTIVYFFISYVDPS